MKKLALFATLTFLATNAYASPFNGAYIGAEGGYEGFSVKGTGIGTNALAGDSADINFGAEGANGGLFAGYGKQFGKLYLGIEGEADVGSATSNNNIILTTGTLTANASHKYDLAASLRPGFMLNDSTLLYARAGVVSSGFDGNGNNGSITLTGFRTGLGAETVISSNITARVDWAYSSYQSHTFTYPDGTVNLSPDSSTFRVGLAYNF